VKLALFVLGICVLGLGACTTEKVKEAPAPDAIALAPEPDTDGPSVSLRGKSEPLAPNRLVVDVVARGARDLHGAAFRLTWDPSALDFAFASSGEAWSKEALAIAKEGSPGQLAVVWSEKGERSIDATNETVIGRLVFDAKSRAGANLAFTMERSQLVDKKGVRVDAKWHGGTIPAR
jgi:hypothetical protein